MFIFDRMYGELKFPSLIKKVLDCPGLLRLREVRMANIPFFSFPSFTAVTRYEHSLGVAHLAKLFSEAVGLSDKERHELILAALYHDVATPPFGHLVEEVLNTQYGYDHERKLCNLVIGNSDEYGGQRAQIYLGKALKLHKICQSLEGRKLGIDPYAIADLTTGEFQASFGDIIASKGIDLDNIDNVIRAATAMGISDFSPKICETLAKSFVKFDDNIYIQEESRFYAYQWQQAREILYSMIFSSLLDFSLQTMLKDALQQLSNDPKYCLKKEDWALTDEQLIYERLLKNKSSAKIINRMRLMHFYQPLSILTFRSNCSLNSTVLQNFVSIAEDIYNFHQISDRSLTKSTPGTLLLNIFADKRKRTVNRKYLSYGKILPDESDSQTPKQWILGLFSRSHIGWTEKCTNQFVSEIRRQFPEVTAVDKSKIVMNKYPSLH